MKRDETDFDFADVARFVAEQILFARPIASGISQLEGVF